MSRVREESEIAISWNPHENTRINTTTRHFSVHAIINW